MNLATDYILTTIVQSNPNDPRTPIRVFLSAEPDPKIFPTLATRGDFANRWVVALSVSQAADLAQKLLNETQKFPQEG